LSAREIAKGIAQKNGQKWVIAPTLPHRLSGLVEYLYAVPLDPLQPGSFLAGRTQLASSSDPLARILDLAEDAILSVDGDQRIVLFNRGAERTFGHMAGEVRGQSLDMLLPQRFTAQHRRHVEAFRDSSTDARQMGERREIYGRRKDGTNFPAEATISKVKVQGEWLFTVILRDITERKLAHEAMSRSLQEKELLLKEIHHRVKNNLQVVSSLLGLQSRVLPEESVRRIFLESQNRIHSMALLHERLYQSQSLSEIDCQEYVRQLAAHLFRSFGVRTDRIRLRVNVESTRMNMDTAVPCGLVLNELVSNSLKYAFPDGRDGEVRVELTEDDKRSMRLSVSDDGVGLPKDFDLQGVRSLGLRLVRTLAEQLGATIEVRSEHGTQVCLTFHQPG
jgi:PAS domain S-box-containing protein